MFLVLLSFPPDHATLGLHFFPCQPTQNKTCSMLSCWRVIQRCLSVAEQMCVHHFRCSNIRRGFDKSYRNRSPARLSMIRYPCLICIVRRTCADVCSGSRLPRLCAQGCGSKSSSSRYGDCSDIGILTLKVSSEILKGPSISVVSYTFDGVSISVPVSSTIARPCTHLEFRRNIAQEMSSA